MNVLDIKLSLYRNVWDVNSQNTMSLNDVLAWIKSGQYGLDGQILKVRNAADSEAMKAEKKSLPGITFNGVFSHRDGNSMKSYSPVTAIDLDHFPDWNTLWGFRNYLLFHVQDLFPFIVAVFISPSGMGLKVICLHDNADPSMHYNLYKQLERKFPINEVDTGVFDISRLTYLSHDPYIYVNQIAQPYKFIYDPAIAPITANPVQSHSRNHTTSYTFHHTQEQIDDNAQWQQILPDKSILYFLDDHEYKTTPDYYKEGSNRQLSLISRAKKLCEYGVLYDAALKKMKYWYSNIARLSEKEVEGKVAYAYSSNIANFGMNRNEIMDLKKQASERGLSWKQRHKNQ